MRNFASTLVKFSKLSHIQTTIWRPPKMAPPRTAWSAGPFVTPLSRRDVRHLVPDPPPVIDISCQKLEIEIKYQFTKIIILKN